MSEYASARLIVDAESGALIHGSADTIDRLIAAGLAEPLIAGEDLRAGDVVSIPLCLDVVPAVLRADPVTLIPPPMGIVANSTTVGERVQYVLMRSQRHYR